MPGIHSSNYVPAQGPPILHTGTVASYSHIVFSIFEPVLNFELPPRTKTMLKLSWVHQKYPSPQILNLVDK